MFNGNTQFRTKDLSINAQIIGQLGGERNSKRQGKIENLIKLLKSFKIVIIVPN